MVKEIIVCYIFLKKIPYARYFFCFWVVNPYTEATSAQKTIFYFYAIIPMKDLIFLGIQCSGKWTQSKLLLKDNDNYEYLEMGQLFRAIMSNDNIIGNFVKDIVNNGKLVDPFVSRDRFYTALEIANKKWNHLLIDWFPRSMSQAEFVVPSIEKYQRDYIVIHLLLSKEKAIERMLKRVEIEGRKDDTIETMNTRITTFMAETLPVIEYFTSLGKVITINGDGTIEEVQAELRNKLGL